MPPFGRAERDVMLDAITLKGSRASVVHVHRQCHRHGALGIRRPFAIVLVDIQVIGDDLELVARHFEYFVVVDSWASCIAELWVSTGKLLFALGRGSSNRKLL